MGTDYIKLERLEREAARKAHYEARRQLRAELITNGCTTPLVCDVCGEQFGWCYEMDLNGSYFKCFDCHARESPK